MATNKVVANGETIIDLTSDTVTAGDLLTGVTAHDRSGAAVTGSLGDFTGATGSTGGAHGLVPAPSAGDEGKFLRGDATWQTVQTGEIAGNVSVDLTQVSPPSTISVASASDLATLAAKVTAFTTTVSLSAANGDYTLDSNLKSGFSLTSHTVGGWTLLDIAGQVTAQQAAGSYTLATIPQSTVDVIGVTNVSTVAHSGSTLFQLGVNTSGATPAVELYLYSAVGANGWLTGSIAFPYVPPSE